MDHAAELVARLLAARTVAHIAHFQTRSYSQHMALEAFYTDILEILDEFCEVYQGLFDVIPSFPMPEVAAGDALKMLVDLTDWLRENRTACAQGETCLQNIIDTAIAVSARAVYKLRTLQ